MTAWESACNVSIHQAGGQAVWVGRGKCIPALAPVDEMVSKLRPLNWSFSLVVSLSQSREHPLISNQAGN